MRDIRDASVYENYVLPKVYYKQYYSIEAAIHHRVVRVRSKEARRNRALLQVSTAPVRTMVLHVLARLQVVPLAATGQVVLLLVPLHLQLLRPPLLNK